MDQYSLGDDGALPSKVHLPPFSDSPGLHRSDALSRDLGPSTRDLLYASLSGLDPDPSLPKPDVPGEALEDSADAGPLHAGKEPEPGKLLEECADPESQVSSQGSAARPAVGWGRAGSSGANGASSARIGYNTVSPPQVTD